MRRITKNIEQVINSPAQISDINTKLATIMRVQRLETLLKNNQFLEKLTIETGGIVTDTDIAISHPMVGYANQDVYITAVVDGRAKLYKAESKYVMAQHQFVDLGYDYAARAVSVAFHSSLEFTTSKNLERKTDNSPWWFVVTNDNRLIAIDTKTDETYELANELVTDVHAIMGPWHSSDDFNYGLVVFFISNGLLMCRRLIHNVWYNAEVINFGPGAPYVSVVSTMTWDYRIAVTVTKDDGTAHTLFTNSLALGKIGSEVVTMNNVSSDLDAIGISKIENRPENEHVLINKVINTPLVKIKGPAGIVSAININNGNNNYGQVIQVSFTTAFLKVTGFGGFSLQDRYGNKIYNIKTELASNGDLLLYYDGFNDFEGPLTLSYRTDDQYIENEYGYRLLNQSIVFNPVNLSGVPTGRNKETLIMKSSSVSHILYNIEKLENRPVEEVVRFNTISSTHTLIKTSDL